MYTLILRSRSARQSYDEFYPILANTVQTGGEVRACDWIEDGTTIETAVPELMSLVERKKHWRAVVVQLDLETEKSGYETVDGNPYNFDRYQKHSYQDTIRQEGVAWSGIPLVRITQMLKGIPEPVPEYSMARDPTANDSEDPERDGEKDPESATSDYIIDHSENISKTKAAILSWNEQRLSNFSPPEEILLVKARRLFTGVRDYELESRWGEYHETDSSRFRARNGYADSCRFLVFDVDTRGELRRRSDLFRLWLSVQILSENRISPSVLQADRLYRMDVQLEEKNLSDNVQKTSDKLNYAQFEISQHLKEAQAITEPEKKPDIEIEKKIDVELEQTEAATYYISRDRFSLAPENMKEDQRIWREYTDRARRKWTALLRSVSRKLAKAAKNLRSVSDPDPKEVYPLTEYQEEDLRDLLDEHYTRILEEQEKLPANEFDIKDELEKREKDAQRAIKRRLRSVSAVYVWLWPTILVVISMCYGFVEGGPRLYLGAAIAAAALLILLCVRIGLRIRFGSFIRVLKRYEAVYRRALAELSVSDRAFSSFFSRIASRIYGENYLAILTRQREHQMDRIEIIQRQVKRVEWFQETLLRWSEALQLDVDPDNKEAVRIMVENRHRLQEEDLYQLETCRPRSVEVGQTGTYIMSSYAFISGVSIEREEVFDRECVE